MLLAAGDVALAEIKEGRRLSQLSYVCRQQCAAAWARHNVHGTQARIDESIAGGGFEGVEVGGERRRWWR